MTAIASVEPADPFFGQARRVGRPGEQRGGEVRAPEALAILELPVVEREAELPQSVGHRCHAPPSVGAEIRQRRLQARVGRVELVAEHVQVLVLLVHGGQLDRAAQADPRGL
jgi:hypothetical protein